jgi:hypothetical protein
MKIIIYVIIISLSISKDISDYDITEYEVFYMDKDLYYYLTTIATATTTLTTTSFGEIHEIKVFFNNDFFINKLTCPNF